MAAGRFWSRLPQRAFIGTLLGVLVAGLFAGGPALGATEDKVMVRWFVGLGAPPEGARDREKAINRVVKAFNKAHPDIKLVADIATDDAFEALGRAFR